MSIILDVEQKISRYNMRREEKRKEVFILLHMDFFSYPSFAVV